MKIKEISEEEKMIVGMISLHRKRMNRARHLGDEKEFNYHKDKMHRLKENLTEIRRR